MAKEHLKFRSNRILQLVTGIILVLANENPTIGHEKRNMTWDITNTECSSFTTSAQVFDVMCVVTQRKKHHLRRSSKLPRYKISLGYVYSNFINSDAIEPHTIYIQITTKHLDRGSRSYSNLMSDPLQK